MEHPELSKNRVIIESISKYEFNLPVIFAGLKLLSKSDHSRII